MRYYATVLGEKRIRVNSVHPTVVATPMAENAEAQRQFAEHPDWAAYTRNPLGVQLIDPADVTEAVLYLCDESGRYVTGVSGGRRGYSPRLVKPSVITNGTGSLQPEVKTREPMAQLSEP
jgi:NAD(P)-dependent dehydrogenase (short-subunit alcohol dehydrogenase family)